MPRLLASAQQCGHSKHVGVVLLDDVQCDHQYGECNTQRRGLPKRESHSSRQVFYCQNIIGRRLHVFWPKYLTRAATNRSLRFLSECGIFARLLIGLINAMAVAGADHFSHSAQLQK